MNAFTIWTRPLFGDKRFFTTTQTIRHQSQKMRFIHYRESNRFGHNNDSVCFMAHFIYHPDNLTNLAFCGRTYFPT